jgi:pyruvate ferredoxin oxidoreductase alpha subunit
MAKIVGKTGNEAMAEAMRQINPDVVAAYPITPATEVVQLFSSFVADGRVDTQFVPTESEHSAMSACIGASASGARVMTSTASQGLALMYEMLYIAAGLRLPIVLAEVNRSLSAPINIHCDHSDTMGARDSGWIQIFSENAQEAYDNLIMAVKIAERASLPAMVSTDGFIISHGMERVRLLEDEEVREFIGEYQPRTSLLNTDKPVTLGPLAFTDFYFELKRSEIEGIRKAKGIIKGVLSEFNQKFNTQYSIFESYHLEDADLGIVLAGSTAGTAKTVVDDLRRKGLKVGLLKIKFFRPLFFEELQEVLSHLKVIAVLDRADSGSSFGGPIFLELRAILYELKKRPLIVNYIYGLGGRDTSPQDIHQVYSELQEVVEKGESKEVVKYLGVRE